MDIILEGPDGGGKSTLAQALSECLDMPVQGSEGPPKFDGEINQRIRKYLDYDRPYIFDRHPVISQAIYGSMRVGKPQMVNKELGEEFYNRSHLFIYVRSPSLSKHVLKSYDTPEHLSIIHRNYDQLHKAYESWATLYARIIYRMGDPVLPIVHYYLALTDGAKLVSDDAA